MGLDEARLRAVMRHCVDADFKTAADQAQSWNVYRKQATGAGTMQPATIHERRDGAAPRPIAELLACPATIGNMLNASAECIEFESGEVVFHQNDICRGLYIVIAGQLLRRTARLDARFALGIVRAGEVVELASMLSDARHTYTLVAQSQGTLMRLPNEALQRAFELYPPLRMRLLEELAREVSRAYGLCCAARTAGIRRRSATSGDA
jgi:hypothetical protein